MKVFCKNIPIPPHETQLILAWNSALVGYHFGPHSNMALLTYYLSKGPQLKGIAEVRLPGCSTYSFLTLQDICKLNQKCSKLFQTLKSHILYCLGF